MFLFPNILIATAALCAKLNSLRNELPRGEKMTKCSNANIGTYGHECGKPAMWAGTHKSGHVQFFCLRCRAEGDEARGVIKWQPCEAVEASLNPAISLVSLI
jgi:hypothetical protein